VGANFTALKSYENNGVLYEDVVDEIHVSLATFDIIIFTVNAFPCSINLLRNT
jgi:hypothetical protein